MSDFVHLHCHTEYSLLDGAIRLKDLCSKAKEFGMSACAITDHGNMFGAAYFFLTCKEFGLKPILGCEAYLCRDHLDKTSATARHRNHLILLAQNLTGYHNLVQLVTTSALEGYYYKPRMDKQMLKEHAEGLICLSACLAGEIPEAILNKDVDRAKKAIAEYQTIFPKRFYLELQSNGLKQQEIVNTTLLELADSTGVPVVATNDCHYLNRKDAQAHEVLLCIQTGKTMHDSDRMRFETDELYYKSTEEMQKAFGHIPQALENTVRIAEACNVELDMGHHYFPVYPLPADTSPEAEFRRLAEEGLEIRLAKHPNKEQIDCELYRHRLQHEIDVILEMGFPGYFLIVQEFINWAKDHDIPVGPGRGSAAGSLVAWAMRITNLDPLPYNLLFERFLNSERVSLPDIDVDFCERRRSEVIQHMRETYGASAVAQITTFGTMKAKGVVRDVGRALGMPLAETDRIAKMIPDDLKMTIDKALATEPELQKLYTENAEVKQLLDTAKCLEGLTRHASTHAAGLVVSDGAMEKYLPLYKGKHDELVTQFDGPMTEKIGLVKFDFLGLKTMTMINDTLRNIIQEGKTPPDLDNLPLDDPQTYQIYSDGETDGIFQVESSGMRKYLRMLKPSCFEDIIAMLALYRPGPLGSGMVDEFIKRKHGQVPIVYPHDSLKNCLKDTYGVIVYQEQVMQIAQIIANYTLGGADLLRRAMGKKKAEAMAKQREVFVNGAKQNKINKTKADEIFDLMEKFAAYGFNKSHSAAYALISYYTAYLKVHYKVEFMSALLTSEMESQDKLLKYLSCCKDMGIEVLPPLVNQSQWHFHAGGGKIIFGLGGIKNVGKSAIESILKAREDNGDFTSLLDLCSRVNLRQVNKRTLESLIKGGACDCFGVSRAGMLAALEQTLTLAQKKNKDKQSKQTSLLHFSPKVETKVLPGLGFQCPEANLPEFGNEEKLREEKDVLGVYLTDHPLRPWLHQIRRMNLRTLEDARECEINEEIRCAVLVVGFKEILTKKNERMAFLNVEDLTGHGEVTVFSKVYAEVQNLLKEAEQQPLLLTATIDSPKNKTAPSSADNSEDDAEDNKTSETQELKLRLVKATLLKNVQMRTDRPLCIHIPSDRLGREDMEALKALLQKYPGSVQTEATINIDGYNLHLKLGGNLAVKPCWELDRELNSWDKNCYLANV